MLVALGTTVRLFPVYKGYDDVDAHCVIFHSGAYEWFYRKSVSTYHYLRLGLWEWYWILEYWSNEPVHLHIYVSLAEWVYYWHKKSRHLTGAFFSWHSVWSPQAGHVAIRLVLVQDVVVCLQEASRTLAAPVAQRAGLGTADRVWMGSSGIRIYDACDIILSFRKYRDVPHYTMPL